MQKDIELLVDESIKLELAMSDLYMLFYKLFPEDAAFWWKLVLEEKNHASLFLSGKEILNKMNLFPVEILDRDLDDIVQSVKRIETAISDFTSNPPGRQKAFQFALDLEESSAEVHFQQFMEEDANSPIYKIFKDLNNEDKEHAFRIRMYMKQNGMQES